MLISDKYQKLNTELHTSKPSYGASLDALPHIKRLIRKHKPIDILDYGCGKGQLSRVLHWPWHPKVHNYDPAIPEYSHQPVPADMLVSTDVLEHIEPEHLDAVLNHMHDLTKRFCLLSIATRPAHKQLPDGRNAHLIVQPIEWWLPKLRQYWSIMEFWGNESEFYVFGTKATNPAAKSEGQTLFKSGTPL